MPKLHVKTISSEQVWKSPDGARKIWELKLQYEDRVVKAQTFSETIAGEGWEGEVETYERGQNTFVKQPPKEDGYTPSQTGSRPSSTGAGSSKGNYQPKDEKAIKAMWAIGQAKDIALKVSPVDQKQPMVEFVSLVETYAQELFLMVDRVKVTEESPEPAVTETKEPSDAVPVTDEQLDNIGEIFDNAGQAAEDVTVEDPWKPKS